MQSNHQVPFGYCQCGCGRKTNIHSRTRTVAGHFKGQPAKFLRGHGGHVSADVSIRFWRYVEKRGDDECWEWTGSRFAKGYGVFCLNKRDRIGAHRMSWTLTNGPIQGRLWVLHRCDNPPCCNPAHLFLGTPVDNVRDMHMKGRDRFSKAKFRAPRLEPWWVEYARRTGLGAASK